jgi:two-component system, OmpR family, phosphate regulon sensor histidine kinase PhoR
MTTALPSRRPTRAARLQGLGAALGRHRLPLTATVLASAALILADATVAVGVIVGALVAWAIGAWWPSARTKEPAPGPGWRDILDALSDPAVVVDGDLAVVHANQPARDLFPALLDVAAIAIASRQPALIEALDAVLADGEPLSVQLLERLPVERRLDASVRRLRVAANAAPMALVVMHDVSERERLAQMRTDFIAHASHELRTPLAAVRGFIETLQGPARDDPSARERFLAIMAAEASRMTRLLDDLLSLSRVEMRAHIAPTGAVDIAEVVEAVVEMMEPVAREAGTTLQLDAAARRRLVRGDRDELVQVFVNILQNAIKYGRPEGHVQVTVTDGEPALGSRVQVAVTDDGPGIAQVHIPRLTERFYRVDVRSSRERGGTGLGLAIVKHVLNRHGGGLRIRSKEGEGSTFTVDLPLRDENNT